MHFVETGDGLGTGGRNQPCLALADPERTVLLDCGATSLVAMRRLGLDPKRIVGIVLTGLDATGPAACRSFCSPWPMRDGWSRSPCGDRWAPVGTATWLPAAIELAYPASGARLLALVAVVELEPRRPTAGSGGVAVEAVTPDPGPAVRALADRATRPIPSASLATVGGTPRCTGNPVRLRD